MFRNRQSLENNVRGATPLIISNSLVRFEKKFNEENLIVVGWSKKISRDIDIQLSKRK